jgi:signal transduction histidine kinase
MITIKDSGIGMPDEIRHNVFKKDKQTSRIGTEGEKGTGFGMPLVKNYMEHFGGKIKVESKDIESFPDDHGTTFTIYFKFDSKNAAQVA